MGAKQGLQVCIDEPGGEDSALNAQATVADCTSFVPVACRHGGRISYNLQMAIRVGDGGWRLPSLRNFTIAVVSE